MSTQSRRKNSSVVDKLLSSPQSYAFFQAVRILERATLQQNAAQPLNTRQAIARNSIAGFAPPANEIIRITTHQSFRFPEAEIDSIVKNPNTQHLQWLMQVNFMGLTGANGVLPYHYTELILQRLKRKDESLAHFLDLFNHRTISLFYQAAIKYRLPLEYERKKNKH